MKEDNAKQEKKELARTEDTAMEENRPIRSALPSVDIYENDAKILLYADMPGVKKEDLQVSIDNGTLSLKGVRRFNRAGGVSREEFSDLAYVRSFSIPQSIEIDRVEAALRDGVLTLHLPKAESARPRLIEINAA